MGPNKNDIKPISKNKVDTSVDTNKTPSNTFQLSKARPDRIPRLKVQRERPATHPAAKDGVLTPQRTIKQHSCVIPEVESETPSSCKKPKTNLKRKSISLEAFSNSKKIWTPQKIHCKEQGDETKTQSRPRPIVDIFAYSSSTKEHELAKKVCKMFILHAWRKRRTQAAELKNTAHKLEKEMENKNIQIVVLKNLMESEKVRANVALDDCAHLRDRLEAKVGENTSLRKSLSQLELEKSALEETVKCLEADVLVLKNDLGVANDVVKHTKEVCAETQRELAASRRREDDILTQLGETKADLRDVVLTLQDERKKSADLQAQVTKLISKNQSLVKEIVHREKKVQECTIETEKKFVLLGNLQNTRKVQKQNIVNLTKDIAVARNKIKEQEHTIKSLEEIVGQFESEKEEQNRNLLTMRNRVVFGGLQIFTKLLFPNQPLKPF